jgi:hypothetical protein
VILEIVISTADNDDASAACRDARKQPNSTFRRTSPSCLLQEAQEVCCHWTLFLDIIISGKGRKVTG